MVAQHFEARIHNYYYVVNGRLVRCGTYNVESAGARGEIALIYSRAPISLIKCGRMFNE